MLELKSFPDLSKIVNQYDDLIDCFSVLADLNSPLLFGRLNGLSSDSTVDILYQMGTTQDAGTKDRYVRTIYLS